MTTTTGLGAYEGATLTAVATDTGSITLSGPGAGMATFVDMGQVIDKLVYTYTPTTTTTPEPATLALIGTGLAGLAIARRRKRKQ
jgi:hypothetical protein